MQPTATTRAASHAIILRQSTCVVQSRDVTPKRAEAASVLRRAEALGETGERQLADLDPRAGQKAAVLLIENGVS